MKQLTTSGSCTTNRAREKELLLAASSESKRLKGLQFTNKTNPALMLANHFEAILAPDGPAIKFMRIETSEYIDGLNEALRDRLLAIPNRNEDMRQWRRMFETERNHVVTVIYPYYMSETIVTNRMFRTFVGQTGYETTIERYKTGWSVDQDAHWFQGISNSYRDQAWPMGEPEHPVAQVSWFDAMNFASWVSHQAEVACRVPTKSEWILSARPESFKDQACAFPWGNDFQHLDRRMNFGTSELTGHIWVHEQHADGYALTSPVKAFPPNERGLHDMTGNVWVWNFTNAAVYEQRPHGKHTATVPRLDELGVDRNARSRCKVVASWLALPTQPCSRK